MKKREPGQQETLLPRHEALPYLKKIEGLAKDDLQLVLTLSNAAGTELVAEACMHTVHAARDRFRPEEITQEDQTGLEYKMRLYREGRAKLERKGIQLEDASDDDIDAGDILTQFLRMSPDEYRTRIKNQIAAERDNTDSESELRTTLRGVKEKVSPAQYARFLAFLDLSMNGEKITFLDAEPHSPKRKLLGEVGKRLSKDWRDAIDENPWVDKALAADITEYEGVSRKRSAVEALQSSVDATRISLDRIRRGDISIRFLEELILLAEPELGTFATKRLVELTRQHPFPGDAIADALSAYLAGHKTDAKDT